MGLHPSSTLAPPVPIERLVALTAVLWVLWSVTQLLYNVFLHPLSKFPGPRAAAASRWWKAYAEVIKGQSMTQKLSELHKKYGPIIRIGPNELHFSQPSVYNEIYNQSLKWDKEETLYHSFGEDRSSFGFLTYKEAKERKNVLNPLFSKRAIVQLQGLIQNNLDALCQALTRQYEAGRSSDLFFAFRCFTMDTITSFCFARSVDAINAPDFRAPIIEAMEAALPMFVLFRNFDLVRRLIVGMPPWLAIKLNPSTAGLLALQQILGKQVKEVTQNPKSLEAAPHPIIYHALLNPELHPGGQVPCAGSLYEEAQALMFAGGDTVGNALMLGTYHLLANPDLSRRLKEELRSTWPSLRDRPPFEELEKLPFLTAVVKESLRISPNVTSPLPRIVPKDGARIGGAFIPSGTIVGMCSVFVHDSEDIFPNHKVFLPDRWLQDDSKSLDQWLVPFSKGPRSCLGINLAYCELYLAFATIFRQFDLEVDRSKPADLAWRDCFVPYFYKEHLWAFARPAAV